MQNPGTRCFLAPMMPTKERPTPTIQVLERAFALQRRPAEWLAVQQHGMALRFDWARAAAEYLRVYTSVLPAPAGT